MKASILNLKKWVLAIGLLFIFVYSNSQDVKLSKEEKKGAKRDKEFYSFQVIDSMLKNKNFVLEADYLENQYGYRTPVLSAVNFIMVDSLNAVLQTGNDNRMGYNGVGGITAEGKISNMKITKNQKSLSFFLRFTVTTQIGFYDVAMNIYSTNSARAEITGLTSGKLIYDGRIQTLYNSRVYKGRSIV